MKHLALCLAWVVVLAPFEQAHSGAWGRTFAVEVSGDSLPAPMLITDPAIVDELSFWVGPGTGHSEFMGPVNNEASIVAWEKGEASDRPEGLLRYQVRFLLEPRDDPPAFIVFYEPDPQNHAGYIYYPKRTNSIVTHGVNGTWQHASARWNERVSAAIAAHTAMHAAE